jgi:hypothetical protein
LSHFKAVSSTKRAKIVLFCSCWASNCTVLGDLRLVAKAPHAFLRAQHACKFQNSRIGKGGCHLNLCLGGLQVRATSSSLFSGEVLAIKSRLGLDGIFGEREREVIRR